MNRDEVLRQLNSQDLVDLGMTADSIRRRLYADRIVTYGTEPEDGAVRIAFHTLEQFAAELDEHSQALFVTPVCGSSGTAAEYLKVLAITRILTNGHVQLDYEWSGLKVAQLGLKFGADDFGNRKPSSQMPEEEIRRVIREAGFIPKRRDPSYRSIALY